MTGLEERRLFERSSSTRIHLCSPQFIDPHCVHQVSQIAHVMLSNALKRQRSADLGESSPKWFLGETRHKQGQTARNRRKELTDPKYLPQSFWIQL